MTCKENKWLWLGVTLDKIGWRNVVASSIIPLQFIILQEVFSSFPSEALPPSQNKNNSEDMGFFFLFAFLQFLSCTNRFMVEGLFMIAGLFMFITAVLKIVLAYSL